MASITFTFTAESSDEERKRVLEMLRQWQNVRAAGAINARSKSAALRRLAYAEVDADTDLDTLSAKINALAEVESAAVPPQRSLIRPKPKRSR